MIKILKKQLIAIVILFTWQLHATEDKCMAYAPINIDNGLLTFIPYHQIIKNDFDCDGILDSNDNDIDNDGVPNNQDAFPRNSAESHDSDSDGIGDNADRPIAYSQSVVVDVENEGVAKTIFLRGSDNDATTLYYTIVGHPKHGTLTGKGPSFTYVADKGYNGTDSFTFKVNDGDIDSFLVRVTIAIRYLAPIIGFSDQVHGIEPWAIDIYGDSSHFIKDINQRGESSKPSDFTVAGDKLYFTANDGVHGKRLWMSSGTNGDVEMIQDGIQSSMGSDIQNIIELDGNIFFTSGRYESANHVNALQNMVYMYIAGSDTAIKIDESSNSGNIRHNDIETFNHKLYYCLNNALNVYDSSTGMKEIIEEGGYFSILGKSTDTLYFVKHVYDKATYRYKESILYKRTNNKNTIIKNFSTYLTYAKVVDDKLFVVPKPYKDLWVYNKTDNNIKLLKSFSSAIVDSYSKAMVSFHGKLYFIGNDTTNGEALWVSDGTVDGTKFFKDISHEGLAIRLREPFVYSDKFYFVSGREPWVSDGTVDGTKILELRDGIYGSYPEDFISFNNKVYFKASNGNSANLYMTDGTREGTRRVTNYTSSDEFSIRSLTSFNKHLFFAGNSKKEGIEVWMSDGTEDGTALFANISKVTKPSVRKNNKYVKMGQNYYFSANDGKGHRGSNSPLWRTDGTSQGTSIVKNTTVTQGLGASQLTVIGNKLFFVAKTASAYDRELWISDGTENGTHLLKDIKTNGTYYRTGSHPISLKNVNGTLFFIADDGEHGYEIWKSDGTENTTVAISNFEEDDFIAGTTLFYMNGMFYFRGKTQTYGKELYKFDIDSGQVMLVKDLVSGRGSSEIEEMTLVGNTIYFTAYSSEVSTKEIWKSDGTTEGTVLVKRIQYGPAYNTISNLTKVGNRVFFSGNDGEHGLELWVTDGSENGTHMVKDITYGDARIHTSIEQMIEVSGKLYFTADDGIHGLELWVSDGTENGTYLVKDIIPGKDTSIPYLYQEIESKLLFGAFDGESDKVWITDGTEVGTKVVAGSK